MGISLEFQHAVAAIYPTEDAGPAQLPIQLSRACVEVLPIVGAGLSLFSAPTMRMPIGASSDAAILAERLQFTVAEGPCFEAHASGASVVAPELVIAARWPLYHDQLVTQTAIRGVVAMPLRDGLSEVGVLDLYCVRSEDVYDINLADAGEVALQIGAALVEDNMFPSFRDQPPWDGPLWLANPNVTARAYVLMAMGMLSVSSGLTLPDSLAALRAHAFGTDQTVDAIAQDVVNRDLLVQELMPGLQF